MPARKALPVQLSSEHERELNELVRAHSTPQRLAERARIILLAATGLEIDETAQRLGIWRKTASHWRRRWRDGAPCAGVAARLSDALFRDSSDGRSATGPDGRLNWPKLGLARA